MALGSVDLSSGASLTYTVGFGSCCALLAVRSVWQHYAPTREVLGLLVVFRRMVNESIRIGIANDASSLRKLSLLSYNQLAQYDSPCCCKLCAISRAAGILASRKKSRRRGLPSRTPYAVRQQLVSCYVFKTKNGGLEIPIRERETSQHTPYQAYIRRHLSTRSHCPFLHPHQEQAESLHRSRRCQVRVHFHGRSGP